MTALAFASRDSCRSLTYRTAEVQQLQHRNTILALGLAIVLHAVFVLSFYLFPSSAGEVTEAKPAKPWNGPWTRKPIDFASIDAGAVMLGGKPKASHVKAGKILSVPVALAEPNVSFATQDELKKGVTLGNAEGVEGADADGTTEVGRENAPPIDELEEEPPEFRLVEQPPIVIRSVTPRYPELLVRAGIEGKVWVKIWVNKQGRPHEVRIVKSDHDLFSDAAVEAAKQFLFTPAYTSGGPVSVWVTVPFSFKLKP